MNEYCVSIAAYLQTRIIVVNVNMTSTYFHFLRPVLILLTLFFLSKHYLTFKFSIFHILILSLKSHSQAGFLLQVVFLSWYLDCLIRFSAPDLFFFFFLLEQSFFRLQKSYLELHTAVTASYSYSSSRPLVWSKIFAFLVEISLKFCITSELPRRGWGWAGTFLYLLFAPLSDPSISCGLSFPPFPLLLSFHFLLTFSHFQVMTLIGPREPVSSSLHPSSPKWKSSAQLFSIHSTRL